MGDEIKAGQYAKPYRDAAQQEATLGYHQCSLGLDPCMPTADGKVCPCNECVRAESFTRRFKQGLQATLG